MDVGPSKITTREELDDLIAESQERPVWLLKHSLLCPLSAEGLRQFRAFTDRVGQSVEAALVEVQKARPLSDEISERTGIRHETPQVILFSGGRARWHCSHWDITDDALERATADLDGGVGTTLP